MQQRSNFANNVKAVFLNLNQLLKDLVVILPFRIINFDFLLLSADIKFGQISDSTNIDKDRIELTTMKNKLDDDELMSDRIDKELLNPFRNNPYTQSLSSFAY